MVQWLIEEEGFEMDVHMMISAVGSGNLELVKWLRGEGCDWNVVACALAAENGQLEVLRWLRVNGCPW